ncbi:MarR family transcriptional regulator [Yersinia sp. Marseille-Q3913]|uniref:MarR family winged helix-turn-helix transcriptional regulator n=1 Tax=Yersinia sp. Marseille-Q3913 TaxID=2830769 RepID=UPI001BAE6368|nr:MarR family transcriptional regulator [Yersinia sp. Marseille-Q3913]MBS0055894.1 MarR family transcriptional regulator [Yersinia sp. Marseille-Q3913]
MNTNLDFCLALYRAHASLQLKLDDELGTYHGISFSDFALLNVIARSDGDRINISVLVNKMGKPQSAVVRQLIALEKIGLVTRDSNNGLRQVVLRPPGRVLVNVARETVESVGIKATESLTPAVVATVFAAMITLADAQYDSRSTLRG